MHFVLPELGFSDEPLLAPLLTLPFSHIHTNTHTHSLSPSLSLSLSLSLSALTSYRSRRSLSLKMCGWTVSAIPNQLVEHLDERQILAVIFHVRFLYVSPPPSLSL